MKHLSRLWLLGVIFLTARPWLASAVLTNTWDFATPSQYVVSDSNRIEVANSVARLILQRSNLKTIDRADYLASNVQFTAAAMGQNSSLGLASTNGIYAVSGVYTSRVFDGGAGNTWAGLALRLSNRWLSPNAWSPIKASGDSYVTSYPNALALYCFDGTWLDSVSGTTGTPYANPQFASDAMLGTQSLSLNGANYFQTVGSTLMHGRSSGSIVLWLKLLSRNGAYGGIVGDRSSGGYTGLCQTGNKVAFFITGSTEVSIVSSNDLPLASWCFVVATFNSGTMNLYLNGRLEGTRSGPAQVTQSNPFLVGVNAYGGGQKTTGLFDQIAFYGRELSESEIQDLYILTFPSPVGVRLRSGATSSLSGDFVGPTNQIVSYYIKDMTWLQASENFNPSHRYVQYAASFYSTSDQLQAPYLESLKFMGSAGEFADDVWGDFVQGAGSIGATNVPARHDTPCVTLGQVGNGVASNGVFTSRVFDAGSSVTVSYTHLTLPTIYSV